ncbi:MAG TPA: hypothetical protein VFA21_20460 [Pyrinomonadaceae bacterium]|nr:hypothetical protein [Pyrinomonadaceae bacterium]
MQFDRGKFFSSYRDAFGPLRQEQVDGLNALLAAFETQAIISDVRHIAYCLATTKHETADTFQPIEEYGKGRNHAYGVPTGQWHQVYDGRGDVQLTWERNYQHATDRLHQLGLLDPALSLDQDPTLVLRSDLAANILIIGMAEGWFTGRKLSDFIQDSACNYVGARRIINGLDRAELIAGYATQFEAVLRSSLVEEADAQG